MHGATCSHRLNSGDDHDYCEYIHRIQVADDDIRTIREVSVRSMSMVMNVKRPGFQLLSLAPAELRLADRPSHMDTPCLLPDQIQIYLVRYLPLVAITILVVFFAIINGVGLPAAGRSQQVFFLNLNNDDSIESDEELNSSHGNTSQPSTPKSYHQRNRSLRGRGWVMFQAAATRREPDPFPSLPFLFKTYCTRPASAMCFRRRRLWVRCIRDIRDIAIFPVVAFVVMNWWVVTY